MVVLHLIIAHRRDFNHSIRSAVCVYRSASDTSEEGTKDRKREGDFS